MVFAHAHVRAVELKQPVDVGTIVRAVVQTASVLNPASVLEATVPVMQIVMDQLPVLATPAVLASDKLALHGQTNGDIWSPKMVGKIYTSIAGLQITDGGFETYTRVEICSR